MGLVTLFALACAQVEPAWPGKSWDLRTPAEAGLDPAKLAALSDLVGGRGCVVRHGRLVYSWGEVAKSGDVASAVKPVISTLLLIAIQEGKLKSVDDRVSEVEPRLGGKDADITWRQLASQTSGYGLGERPGMAYSYNDYALALYYDTLIAKVFKEEGTRVLKTRLGDILQFEDPYTFEAFGPTDRPGRLAVSVRDFARFGLLVLREGKWRDRQVIERERARLYVSSPIAPGTPLTAGKDAEMLPGQRTLGGTKNITRVGPGYYSFNWWLNRLDASGRRLYPDAPTDTILASGHGGQRALWIFPGLDLIVCWNDTGVKDHDSSPGNRDSLGNRAARLMLEAVQDKGIALGIRDTQFTLNGVPTFLLGMSYYGGLGAPDVFLQRDLDDMRRHGFNWIRVWATWGAFENDLSAVDAEGRPREAQLARLRTLVEECDRRGIVVDVSLSRGNGVTGGPRLQSLEAHRRAVETIVGALKPRRNWYLDLSNERNIRDQRHTSFADLKELREAIRRLDAERLVTASHAGDIAGEDLREYLETVCVDFISPHRPRNGASAPQTEDRTRAYLATMKELGRVVPVHYQEPFRRGFGPWAPKAEDFLLDLRGARAAGAAGWCLHNGHQREGPSGEPRRSFDLRSKRLFDQLDEEERKVLQGIGR